MLFQTWGLIAKYDIIGRDRIKSEDVNRTVKSNKKMNRTHEFLLNEKVHVSRVHV